MKKQLVLALVAVAVAGATSDLACQSFVFPNDHEKFEGSSGTSIPLLFGTIRHQQCVSEARGKTIVARSISWRRSTQFAPSNPGSATVTLQISMGNADYAKIGTTFAQNWTGTPTVVIKTKTVKSPAWATPSKTMPAPFDWTIPLDNPYVHRGQNDLLVETLVTSTRPTQTPGSLNAVFRSTNGEKRGASRDISKGCLVGGREQGALFWFRSISDGADSKMLCRTYGAHPLRPAVFLFGFTNPNLTIAGLCTTVNTSAEVAIPLGLTDGLGLAELEFSLGPWDGKLAGTSLYGQALAIDPTQSPIAIGLSAGKQLVLPPQKEGPVVMKNLWSANLQATSVSRVGNSGTIFRLN